MSRICRALSQISVCRALMLSLGIDLWQQFYRSWHFALCNLRLGVDLCRQFYKSWHLESLHHHHLIIIIIDYLHRSQANMTWQADTRTRLTRPCFLLFALLWLHKMTWLHKLTLLHKLTRELSWHALVFLFICFPMNSQADMTSQAHITSNSYDTSLVSSPWYELPLTIHTWLTV